MACGNSLLRSAIRPWHHNGVRAARETAKAYGISDHDMAAPACWRVKRGIKRIMAAGNGAASRGNGAKSNIKLVAYRVVTRKSM